ncbi:MAG: RNA polymerase sigma factor [Prevotella sp.]|nr:RNA polymerase sigma factor [Prevotella sp.]MBR7043377.1 RNA polymerase sigma factor [Prevotella sp.]MBR7086987.1 RNA polymerase sigma factor [Prevotella sp.]
MSPSDLSLLTQATVFHNKRAFGQLVEKYQSPIRRFFLNQTGGDSQLSDDLAQDTFVKAYVNIGQFRGGSSFSTWLYRIAYNVFYDYTRTHKLTEQIDQAVALRQANSADTALRLDLQQALSILSPAERSCITLQLMEGQPIDQISAITEMAEGTVKSHLSRGKQKLAMYLRKNGY